MIKNTLYVGLLSRVQLTFLVKLSFKAESGEREFMRCVPSFFFVGRQLNQVDMSLMPSMASVGFGSRPEEPFANGFCNPPSSLLCISKGLAPWDKSWLPWRRFSAASPPRSALAAAPSPSPLLPKWSVQLPQALLPPMPRAFNTTIQILTCWTLAAVCFCCGSI